ncbi:polysaccharide deacetylase family protein [Desulforudis sp. 1088]|uniref:polysaccharide deacetylase family protein n=1 Tax=unclassified Candidatus Desulforudis TaxID=2635950 RepID=UPI003CE5B114
MRPAVGIPVPERRKVLFPLLLGLLALFIGLAVARVWWWLEPLPAPLDQGVPVLMYHKVSPDRKAGGYGLRVHPREFAWQMNYLAGRGFTAISPRDLERALYEGAPLPARPILITFDDGYRDNYLYALPVLEELGMQGTVFVVAGAIGKTNFFDAESQPPNAMMSWEEIRAMERAGITIGSHTLTHPHLTQISTDQARREIVEAKRVLEKGLGHEVRYFCYPYGDYNPAVEALVAEAGYTLSFTCDQGRVTMDEERPLALKRLRVTGHLSRRDFAYLLAPEQK